MNLFARTDTATIHIAKAICSPTRPAITGVLGDYHVVIHKIDEWAEDAHGNHYPQGPAWWGKGVTSYQAIITVNPAAVKWVEYLLLRSGKFQILSELHDPHNKAQAAKWAGTMPRPWAAGAKRDAWVEPDCHGAPAAKQPAAPAPERKRHPAQPARRQPRNRKQPPARRGWLDWLE